MTHLQVGGHRHAIAVGDVTIGSDPSCQIVLSGDGVAARHAIVQGLANGQVAIRLAAEDVEVQVNGVRLGPNPHPLLHGDKVEIAGQELLFVDERRSGSTQYVQAMDPGVMARAANLSAKSVATSATGGRLVSLTDGREYEITGNSVTIGRDASCDVVVTSKNVSRRHAEVLASPKGYLVVDSSTNGTFVNGTRVEGQRLLARGDLIECGEAELRFYADVVTEPAPAGAAPAPETPAVPPPGADYRLSNTLHGVPGIRVSQPGSLPKEAEPKAAPQPAARRSAATAVLANLVVRSGDLKGQRFPIRVPVVNVGRAEYNDIAIPEDSISTTHAKLQRREGIWILVDLDSTNGTMVDGEAVQGEVPLAPGALIRFGDVQTIFEPTDDRIDAKKGSSTKVIEPIREVHAVSGPQAAAPDRPTPPAARPTESSQPAEQSSGLPWWLFFLFLVGIAVVALLVLGAG